MASPLVPSHAELRDTTRVPVSLTGDLGNSRLGKRRVVLLDISGGGCRVETSLDVPPGTAIIITIPGLAPMSCEVRWNVRGMLGLRFKTPLHAGVVSHILAMRR